MTNKQTLFHRIIFGSSIAHFANDLSVMLISATLPLVAQEFQLNYAMAGLIVTSIILLMNILQTFVGYIASRTDKLIPLLVSGLITISAASFLVSLSADYIHLIFFQSLIGVGASVYHPVSYSLLSNIHRIRDRRKALGYVTASGDSAVPFAFLVSGFLAPLFGWRTIYILWGSAVLITAFVVFYVIGKCYENVYNRSTFYANKFVIKDISKLTPLILIVFLLAANYRVISSFTVFYLTDLGMPFESANLTVVFMMIIGTIGAALSGTLTNKIGEKNVTVTFCVILTLTSIITTSIDNAYLLIPIICIIGYSLVGIWPTLYSYIAKAANKNFVALTYGMIFTLGWGGGALFPYVAGMIADFLGLKSIYLIVAILSFMATVIAYLKLENSDFLTN